MTLFGMTALFAQLIELPALEITPLRWLFAGLPRPVVSCAQQVRFSRLSALPGKALKAGSLGGIDLAAADSLSKCENLSNLLKNHFLAGGTIIEIDASIEKNNSKFVKLSLTSKRYAQTLRRY